MTPILLGLLLFLARGSAQSMPPVAAPSVESWMLSPAPSPYGTLKECSVSGDAVNTTYKEDLEQTTTGRSVCGFLGVEPFYGDRPFSIISTGTQTLGKTTLSYIEVTIGDQLVTFRRTPDAETGSVAVLNINYTNIDASGNFEDSATLVLNSTLTKDPLALATAGNATATAAPGRRLMGASPSTAASRWLLQSDPTDALCDASKAMCGAVANATQALGALCPAAEADRLAVARSIMQTCAASLDTCSSEEPLDLNGCEQRSAICYTRLAQLLTCAAGRRCEKALEAGDRKQLGCDQQRRDPQFSKGCTGKVATVSMSDLSSFANKYELTVADLRAANPYIPLVSGASICIPGTAARCGEKLPSSTTDVYRFPVEGKTSATLTWAVPSSYSGTTLRIRDQQSGTILYSTGVLKNSTGSKTIGVPAGTTEIALVAIGNYPAFNASVSCE